MLNCYVISGTFVPELHYKAAIKREQSQTCLSYAERKQLRVVYRRKINKKSRFYERYRASFFRFFKMTNALYLTIFHYLCTIVGSPQPRCTYSVARE